MGRGYLHDRLILDPIDSMLRAVGASVCRECPVDLGDDARGLIDLLATLGETRVAIEAELSPLRVHNDVAKAVAAMATWLFIVTPTEEVAQAARIRLSATGVGGLADASICVLPLGRALKRIRECFPLISVPFQDRKTENEVL